MVLSDNALRVLTDAGQHALRLATPPKHLPTAACNAVVRSLLKGGSVEECPAPFEYINLGWRQQDGAWSALRVTDAGTVATGAVPHARTAVDDAKLSGLTQAAYDAELEPAQRAPEASVDLSAPDLDDDAMTQADSQ
jgi:hypothetical protein